MIIKRENWKGKYRIVARDDKGRILSHTKPKKNLEFYKNRFKQTGSFIEGLYREKLAKVTEYRRYDTKRRVSGKYQVVIEGYFHGEKIHIRSRKEDRPYNVLLSQAENDFKAMIFYKYFGSSDPDISPQEEKEILRLVKNRKEGIVYYR